MDLKKRLTPEQVAALSARREAREARLKVLGYEEPTEEQHRQNLALNIALLPWPK